MLQNLLLFSCFVCFSSAYYSCEISQSDRTNCVKSEAANNGLTQAQCQKRGCCFDGEADGTDEIRCYRRNRLQDAAGFDTLQFSATISPNAPDTSARRDTSQDLIDGQLPFGGRKLGDDYGWLIGRACPGNTTTSPPRKPCGLPVSKLYRKNIRKSVCVRQSCCWDDRDQQCFRPKFHILKIPSKCEEGFANPPKCDPIVCEDIGVVAHSANVANENSQSCSGSQQGYNTVCSVTCSNGFVPSNGVNSVTCIQDEENPDSTVGKWSGNLQCDPQIITLDKQEMVKYLKNIDFGTIEKDGSTSYKVENIRVSSFDLDEITLEFAGERIEVAVKGAEGEMDADYWIKQKIWFTTIKNSGRIKVSFSGVTVSAAVTMTPSGQIKIVSCRPAIGYLKARVEGSGLDRIINTILSFFDGKIKKKVSDSMCPALEKAVQKQSGKIMENLSG